MPLLWHDRERLVFNRWLSAYWAFCVGFMVGGLIFFLSIVAYFLICVWLGRPLGPRGLDRDGVIIVFIILGLLGVLVPVLSGILLAWIWMRRRIWKQVNAPDTPPTNQ